MEKLQDLKINEEHKISGVPIVIFGATYSAKAVVGYFGVVATITTGVTTAALSDQSCK